MSCNFSILFVFLRSTTVWFRSPPGRAPGAPRRMFRRNGREIQSCRGAQLLLLGGAAALVLVGPALLCADEGGAGGPFGVDAVHRAHCRRGGFKEHGCG